ncbi:MAG: efflux RND transporter periplasmic adaptor subunit [Armatimonadota bacterium]|nr:efflux RND transporter periplasmic adaptor subunit [Armatimonadota bacterium]MDR7426686.1 efflux RND transporter periplasmic adaptor subunit [Armatimonadota bacterium]MDR7465074.1 efflux RND transporter periplasmic adaptor subunit [Armatimonadota bacterium]MDR7469237.1 efflux RND transporter periplasmic adaptor subunit [Armatimonadota bacterium]MDR7475052.1 efflux RND transporter periplasmic adaptor subunit [Armatimonadota bacterium]
MRRVAVVVVVVALLATAAWVVRGRTGARAPAQGRRTAVVVRGDLVVSVSGTGTLQPYAQVEVRSRATGTVAELRVQEGDHVNRGQLLAVIEDEDARAAYAAATAQLAVARARLDQSRRSLAAARAQNAARVAQAEKALATAQARLAQVLAGSRPEEVAQAGEALRQAELALDLARQNLERTQQLYAAGFVPRVELDQAQNHSAVAEAQVRAARARLQALEAGNRAEDIAVARAQVREAEATLAAAAAARLQEDALAADVAAAEAAVRSSSAQWAQARDRLRETQITAPISGIIAVLAVQRGQSVIGGLTGGTLVLTIADLRVIQAHVPVDEADVAQIRPGMAVRITADALPERTFAGRVERIAPQSTVVQNVIQFNVVVTLQDPDPALRLGMSVDAEFLISERKGVLLVPTEAVRGTDRRQVLVVDGEALVPVPVETGATNGRFVEIIRGLREGQVIYLGPAAAPGRSTAPQPISPFQPQFPRRTAPGRN